MCMCMFVHAIDSEAVLKRTGRHVYVVYNTLLHLSRLHILDIFKTLKFRCLLSNDFYNSELQNRLQVQHSFYDIHFWLFYYNLT